ncbi:MAG TPA: ATP-binding protein [Burkholderiales bacterium]|nr:ATP-binding protein [Burkholderiales bacterium]
MTTPERRRFSARLAEFDAIATFIETACGEMKDEERLRIVLIVEELFANSVNHGYCGDSDQPVWLTLSAGEEDCHVVYEDCAPEYDPFAVVDTSSTEADVDTRRVGGLGLVLLVELSTSRSYQRRGTHNVVELRIPHRK